MASSATASSAGSPTCNSRKPVLAVDVDEVLAFFIPALAEFHNEAYGGNDLHLTPDSFVSYDFHNIWGGSKEECLIMVNRKY